jgi:uncharacterized repeat protein (TIGR01451 family)
VTSIDKFIKIATRPVRSLFQKEDDLMILNTWKCQIPKLALLLVVCLVVLGSIAGLAGFAQGTSGWTGGVQWLLGQQVPNSTVPTPASGRSGLVISYIVPPSDPSYPYLYNRSWIYDDALAVISWSMEGECQAAEDTLSTLAGLLDAGGKLGFSYNTADHWFDSTRYRTGAIAWVGYSFTFYQRLCGDSQFQSAAENIADWILTMQDPSTGSVKGGPDVDWLSTEHNIDAYFFLRDIGWLTSNTTYLEAADRIKQSLLTNHWNPSYGCFQQGIGDTEKVLDVASWGALFLLSTGQPDKADSCLDFIEANFPTTVTCDIGGVSQNISGYKPDVNTNLVWSEGSLGVAMAYQRADNQAKHDEIVTEIWKMQGPNGGIVYACPKATDFPDWESTPGTAWMVMLQSDQQAAFWDSYVALSVTKQANPSLVQDGVPLTYTIHVANTGDVPLTATITDTLPSHVIPTGVLVWTPTITAPGGIWMQQVVVTVEAGYTGRLTNKVQVTTEEGAVGTASATVCANSCPIYLPLILKNRPVPWITVTASGSRAWGQVGPPSFCSGDYKVALYAKTDIWYVQPYKDSRRNVQIKQNCTWESFTHDWDQVAAHLAPSSYYHPDEIREPNCPPPPLDPDTNPNVLVAGCYP